MGNCCSNTDSYVTNFREKLQQFRVASVADLEKINLEDFDFDLDDFEIKQTLGDPSKGSTSKVNRVIHKSSSEEFALKEVNVKELGEAEFHQFETEIKMHAFSDHPHLVRFYGYKRIGNKAFILFEYFPVNLEGFIQKKLEVDSSLLSDQEIMKIYLCVLNGLVYLQNFFNMPHRDLKPSNIMTDHNLDRIKIIDFGHPRSAENPASKVMNFSKLTGG
jgi:serine/threonine protein kinase